jgi:hypothetical protein
MLDYTATVQFIVKMFKKYGGMQNETISTIQSI